MKKKQVWIESLRIFALFWVIYNHTSIYGWTLFSNGNTVLSGAETVVNFVLFAFCKISVPLFLMISGALLLGRDEVMKKTMKRVSRMVILIVVVLCANYAYFSSIHHEYTQNIHSFVDFLKEAYGGTNLCTYYLWLYLGFLICLPLLREIAKKRELIVYAAVIYLVLQEILPAFELRFGWTSFNLKAYGGVFAIYYICPLVGYWLATSETIFTKKNLAFSVFAAVVSLATNIWIAVWAWQANGYTWVITPLVLSACLFYFAKYFSRSNACARLCQKRFYPALEKGILALSPQTLGAFLLSGVLMWKVFPVYTYLQATASGTLAALVWVLAGMLLCQAVTAVLRLIPFMKKLL